MIEITTIRMRELHAVAREMSFAHADIKEVVLQRFGRHSLKDMTEEEAVEIILEWRHEMRPTPPKETKMPMKSFPRLLVARPAQNTPKKPPVLPVQAAPAPVDDAADADIDYLPEPIDGLVLEPNFDDEERIITKPLQPATEKPGPLYAQPTKPGKLPVRPPVPGEWHHNPPVVAKPIPSFLKGGTPLDAPPPKVWPQAPVGHHNPITIKAEDRPRFEAGLRMPLRPQAPKPPEPAEPVVTKSDWPAPEPVQPRQTGGFGRLRAAEPTDDVEPPQPNEKYVASEFAQQTRKAKIPGGLTADDIPW